MGINGRVGEEGDSGDASPGNGGRALTMFALRSSSTELGLDTLRSSIGWRIGGSVIEDLRWGGEVKLPTSNFFNGDLDLGAAPRIVLDKIRRSGDVRSWAI